MSYKQRAKSVGMAKKKIKGHFLINLPFEFTDKQKEVIETIADKDTTCVFVKGSAGTGKSHLAVYSGLQELLAGNCQRLIYIRSAVESAHSKLGYLKGQIEDKFGPYAQILNDKLSEMLTEQEIASLNMENKIEAMPVSFLRGKDFKNTFIIVDECQSIYDSELKTIISRVGKDSKIVFLFDPKQSDITDAKHKQDVVRFSNIFKTEEAQSFGIHYREFTNEDIMRSPFCKFVMEQLEKADF